MCGHRSPPLSARGGLGFCSGPPSIAPVVSHQLNSGLVPAVTGPAGTTLRLTVGDVYGCSTIRGVARAEDIYADGIESSG